MKMLKVLKKSLFLLTVSFSSPLLMAADSSVGCGLGNAVTQRNSLFATTTRATTNGLSSNQTFGMTSGTSGCAKHSIVMNHTKALHLAESNMWRLRMEMSLGNGEMLNAFVSTYNCNQNVNGQLRSHLNSLSSDQNFLQLEPSQLVKQTESFILTNKLEQHCAQTQASEV